MLGVRSIVGNGCSFDHVVMMGADCYESPEKSQGKSIGLVPIGVGDGTRVEEAIIDKNARIGEGRHSFPQRLVRWLGG